MGNFERGVAKRHQGDPAGEKAYIRHVKKTGAHASHASKIRKKKGLK